jgi:hypothetical protein
MTTGTRRRPTPFEWLWYAFGGRLGTGLRDWVRRDLTGRSWVVRHVCRALVQCAIPAAALIVWLPGPLTVRLGTAALGVIVALYYSTTYVQQIRTNRLIKYGWPGELGMTEQADREAGARDETERAYAAAWRVRSDPR